MPSLGDYPTLPFEGTTARSRHASWTGAKAAEPRAGSQALRVLVALKAQPMTDHELSHALGLPLATICARRNALVKMGLVIAFALVEGPYRAKNTQWSVT